MKQFFRFTFLKLILALIIMILPLLGIFLYNKSIIVSESETLKIEANPVIEGLYYISNIILLPIRLANIPIWKLLLEDYYSSNIKEISPAFFYSDWLLSLIFFLLPLVIEAYIISCFVSFLVEKITKKKKSQLL